MLVMGVGERIRRIHPSKVATAIHDGTVERRRRTTPRHRFGAEAPGRSIHLHIRLRRLHLLQVHLKQGTGEGRTTHPHTRLRRLHVREVHLKGGTDEDGGARRILAMFFSLLVKLLAVTCNFN
jgi:hypothetical protein